MCVVQSVSGCVVSTLERKQKPMRSSPLYWQQVGEGEGPLCYLVIPCSSLLPYRERWTEAGGER
jgi:hypothetical protein